MRQQRKKVYHFLLMFLSCSLFSGCAFFIKGVVPEPVQITSVPAGATCEVYNMRTNEKISTVTTPATVQLKKRGGYFKSLSYRIACNLDKQQPQEALVEGTVSGWYWANILFGGLIGMLIVDPATGAMWTYEPETVIVNYEDPGKSILNISSMRVPDRGFRTRLSR
jgi:hypothetical protein